MKLLIKYALDALLQKKYLLIVIILFIISSQNDLIDSIHFLKSIVSYYTFLVLKNSQKIDKSNIFFWKNEEKWNITEKLKKMTFIHIMKLLLTIT